MYVYIHIATYKKWYYNYVASYMLTNVHCNTYTSHIVAFVLMLSSTIISNSCTFFSF